MNAPGIIIEARVGMDDLLEYVRCVKKSGNRALHVIFRDYRSVDQEATEVLAGLRNLGCTYEGMPPRLISVNVPPKVNLRDVADFLRRRSGLEWEYADSTYEQVTRRIRGTAKL